MTMSLVDLTTTAYKTLYMFYSSSQSLKADDLYKHVTWLISEHERWFSADFVKNNMTPLHSKENMAINDEHFPSDTQNDDGNHVPSKKLLGKKVCL